MMIKKLMTRTFLIGPILATLLGAGVLIGCTGDTGPGEGRDPASGTASQEVSERGGGESGGEHGGGEGAEGGESSGGESGGEGTASSSEEGSGANLAPDETFDMVRSGARLILNYDAASNSFKGIVENTTNNVLGQVRIEVHLSNGTELGPTTPVDLAPGQTLRVALHSTQASFTGWIAHAEVGSGGEGSQSGSEGGGEHGGSGEGSGGEGGGGEAGGEGGGESRSESSSEGGGTGAEAGEAAMSSPIVPLGQSWNGVLGGLAVSARYDAATQSVQATVQNTLSQVLCYVQAEPHLKSGTKTVGELGPDVLGHLSPGQEATSSVAVSSEPSLAGVAYDGYVVHLEVFDCGGTGPVPHTGGEGAEGSGSEGAGGEGSESGSEEGSGANLAPDETFDMVRSGARLALSYDAASNSFKGAVENTTNNTLSRVRIEVHLSNGTELGPTTPVDLAPGEKLPVTLPSTQESFTGWIAHAEVGGGEGGESGGEGGGESGGEHGSGGESGGEHGSGGERRGGG